MAAPREAWLRLETVEGTGLRFRTELDSGPTFLLDSGPGVPYPNPVEAVLAALAACEGMDVISILRRKRQTVLDYEIVARGERSDEHPRIWTRIEVVHRLRGRDLDPKAIEDALRLSETKYCSVHAMLEKTVAIASRFEVLPA
jgi:putative redox protein